MEISYSKESIVTGFKEQDGFFLENIYKDVFPSIRNYIRLNSGNKHDAEDIFHDSLIIILNKINKNDFDLCCSFKTFVLSVCKHIWLNKLRRQGIVESGLQDEETIPVEECVKIDEEDKCLEEHKLFKKHFYQLAKPCQNILRSIINGGKPKEIFVNMNFSSEGSLRQKLLKCKLELLNRIKSDKKFQELKDEN